VIFFDRSCKAVPPSLAAPSVAVAKEKAAAIAYYAQNAPGAPGFKSFAFKAYKEWDVKEALRIIFCGKCAYCETEIGASSGKNVEHYRPKGGVNGDPLHPGYWWLAHNWENLLPACRGCNMALRQHTVAPTMTRLQVEEMMVSPPAIVWGKANNFPVGSMRAMCATDDLGAEDAYLIDPTKQDPSPELSWLSTSYYSVVIASVSHGVESPYGRETVRCCALNRVELVQARTAVLNELRLQRAEIVQELELGAENPEKLQDHLKKALARAAALRRYYDPERPYAGMAKAFVQAFETELSQWHLSKVASAQQRALT